MRFLFSSLISVPFVFVPFVFAPLVFGTLVFGTLFCAGVTALYAQQVDQDKELFPKPVPSARLNTEELTELLTDKTLLFEWADDQKQEYEYHSPGGCTSYAGVEKGSSLSLGRYWIGDGVVCYRYPSAEGTWCYDVYKDQKVRGRTHWFHVTIYPNHRYAGFISKLEKGNSRHFFVDEACMKPLPLG